MSEKLENSMDDKCSSSMDATIAIEQITPRKGPKRKHKDKSVSSKRKRLLETPDYSAVIPNPTTSSQVKLSSTKKRVEIDPQEVHNILGGMEEEIDEALENAAKKNNLSRLNVKNILRHVMTNEYVLSMVRNTMKIESGSKELEEAVFEPKITRAKAKELGEINPWLVPAPIKKADEVTQLLEKEFPEESSDDEDYKPNEEEERSDDDDTLASPRTSELFSPRTEASEISSPAPQMSPAPVEKVLDHYAEDENALVIEFPDINPPSEISEADKIALRTRSKLKLTDTPLEEIEASFFAPDITVDMYDTACDNEEWQKFLTELCKPMESKAVENVGETNEVEEDHDDPDFCFEEESPDPLDLVYDRTAKISKEEANDLLTDILKYAELEYLEGEDEEEEEKNSSEINDSATSNACSEERSEWMNAKLVLDEQMRMYIQLLTQSYLLSHGSSELHDLNYAIKLYMGEIAMYASQKSDSSVRSAFNAYNLDEALKIINKFEQSEFISTSQRKLTNSKVVPVPVNVKRTLATSKVFIYPELLPTFGFCKPYTSRKTQFCAAEDNLIAIGLEQFSSCGSTLDMIQKWLLPCKTVQQLKVRIKICRSSKISPDNPIKYFNQHKVAPPYQRIVRIFDPDNVKTPAEFPLEVLPRWMTYYNRVASGHPMFVPPPPIAPAPSSQPISPRPIAPVPATQPLSISVPPVAVVRPTFRKVPEKRKSRLILPHGAIFSPLKQITPFLKKYSPYPKRTITVLPFTMHSPSKPKCGNLTNKTKLAVPKKDLTTVLRTIKPKPIIETANSAETNYVIIQAHDISDNLGVQQGETTVNSNNNLPPLEPVLNNETMQLILSDTSVSSPNQNEAESLTEPLPGFLPAQELQEINNIQETSKSENVSTVDMDIDETLEEDEQESSAVATVSSKKQTISKKRNRVQKDLESSLALLEPSMINNDPKKAEREILFTHSYLLRAAETLKNVPDTWNLFLVSLCKYQNCVTFPVKLYLELKVILKDYPALLDDFVAFLKPAEAKLVGKFKQYLMLTKIRDFLRKVEVHFSNQPHHIPKIVRALSQFGQQSYVTSNEALSGLLPLLRNQTHLVEELTQLIPDAAPPLYLQTDFEDVTFPNSDEDASSSGSCENIKIPDTPDPYGGKDCPCKCHSDSTDSKMLNRSPKCVKSGVKFMDGRIYLQTGKVLKPAQVTYLEMPPELNGKEGKNSQKDSLKTSLSNEMILKALADSESAARLEALKKERTQVGYPTSKMVTLNSNESLPTCSKLPCDVIEDTVFPTVANATTKSAPSDFSLLRDMIGSKEKTSLQPETDDKQVSIQKKKWSREEDRLIIYDCQRLGIRKETFSVTAKTLKDRTAEEVEERFLVMVELMSKNSPSQ